MVVVDVLSCGRREVATVTVVGVVLNYRHAVCAQQSYEAVHYSGLSGTRPTGDTYNQRAVHVGDHALVVTSFIRVAES